MSTVELLAPAGNPEALDAAIGEGADAVYLGLKSFNARMRSQNFAFNQFEALVETCQKNAKKVYVTVNTVFEERESDRMYQLLEYLNKVGPDGLIVQDFGVAHIVETCFPKLKLHASTQMNIASARAANLLSKHGFNRVVLARELSLDEIRKVNEGTNLELEFFVHGALCVSASGLCLFSSYLGGKSANRGCCAQACRRLYSTEGADGYYFSPDDLELIGQVPDLVAAGVDSFKIEGRMKSAEYVGAVVAAYRHMLDNYKIDPERALAKARAILAQDFARRKTTFNITGSFDPDYIRPDQAGGTGLYLGKVKDVRVIDEKRYALVDSYRGAAGIAEGDSLRLHSADDSKRVTAKVRDIKETPKGLLLYFDADFVQGDTVYLVQTRSMGKRWKPVIPKDLDHYHKFPSHNSCPAAVLPHFEKDDAAVLPEGLYSVVDQVADLHLILSARPQKAMIVLDRKNGEGLRLHEKDIPFKRDSLILWLDPYLPEADSDWLAGELEYWVSRGQRLFVANNLGHITMLKALQAKLGADSAAAMKENAARRAAAAAAAQAAEARAGEADSGSAVQTEAKTGAPRAARSGAARSGAARGERGRGGRAVSDEIVIIAGPWLYTFNRQALAFLLGEGCRFVIPPYEISKQDLFKVSEGMERFFLPLAFAYPPLFRIRADLASKYSFRFFTDREGQGYELVGRRDYSTVIPQEPFSIVDRIPYLKKDGYSRFVLDFSRVAMAKSMYKQVMHAADEGVLLPETGRFNWKDGFWRPAEN